MQIRRTPLRVTCLVVLMMVALSLPTSAVGDRPVAEVLDLSSAALNRFAGLQDLWLEWLASAYEGDRGRASSALDRLLSGARDLGMERLPDLSLGAAGRAIGFAAEGRFDAAGLSLAAAEAMDPNRPEVAFAAARVARFEGRHWLALRKNVEGFTRMFDDRLLRHLWLADLQHWLLFVVVAAGALFVATLMATRGVELYADIYSFVARSAPGLFAVAVTMVLLLWPVLLPAGLLWLTVYWAILLWSYGSRAERILLVALWVVLGAAPILLNEQHQRVRVALAPTTLSMESLASGKLRGSLFGDLAVLRAALPESVAVSHLIADLHCRLEEWSSARELYRQILEREPDNGTALLNLGVCYFHQGETAPAIEYFQRAAQTDEAAGPAHFNLSQTLSELYRFREAERELRMAQQVSHAQVGEWLRRAATERVILLDGGLARSSEIRADLLFTWRSGEADARWSGLWPRFLSLPLALAFVVIAASLHFIVRRRAHRTEQSAQQIAPEGTWRSALLPGIAEVESGHSILGYLALLLPMVLVSLPLLGDLGYRLPWIYAPGNLIPLVLATGGLSIYLLLRILGRRGGLR